MKMENNGMLITRSLLLINCNLKSTRKWINCNLRKITWCDEGKIIFLQSTKNNIDFMVMLLCCLLPAIIKYGTKANQQSYALGIKKFKSTKSALEFLILMLNTLVTIYINLRKIVRYNIIPSNIYISLF